MTIANTNKLALFGGEAAFKKEFQTYNSLGDEEIIAVNEVMKSAE